MVLVTIVMKCRRNMSSAAGTGQLRKSTARKREPEAAGRLSGLNDVNIRITESLDLDTLPQEVVDGARWLTGALGMAQSRC